MHPQVSGTPVGSVPLRAVPPSTLSGAVEYMCSLPGQVRPLTVAATVGVVAVVVVAVRVTLMAS